MTGVRHLCFTVALCAIAIGPPCAGATDRIDDTHPIQVRIENATGERLRCVAVLAHFVTRALPPIPDGGSLQITLQRDGGSGSLSYGSHGDHPMMLENLLCGTDSDWSATSRDLPVPPLRSDKARHFSYRCGLRREGVSCALR